MDTFDKIEAMLAELLEQANDQKKNSGKLSSKLDGTRITSSCTKSFKLNNLIGLQKNGPSRHSVGFMTSVTNGYGLSISCLP